MSILKPTIFFCLLSFSSSIFAASDPVKGINPAYDAKLINITKKLFYEIKIGLPYQKLLELTKKPPLYCNDYNGNPIDPKIFMGTCHWDGSYTSNQGLPSLNVSVADGHVTDVNAVTQNGISYAYQLNGKILVQPMND